MAHRFPAITAVLLLAMIASGRAAEMLEVPAGAFLLIELVDPVPPQPERKTPQGKPAS